MKQIRQFLMSPEQTKDEFWESNALIWVDWREDDNAIIRYVNKHLSDADKIQFECVDSEKERGIDILLKKEGDCRAIPYADGYTDRDTTLKSIQQYLAPNYQLRWYMGSLGGDTLAFCVLPAKQWEQLEQEFGTEKVAYYFAPIQSDSVMFEMDMDEVWNMLEQRGENAD